MRKRLRIYRPINYPSPLFTTHYVLLFCCSMAKSCPILCDPTDCSTLGFTVLHYLPEFAEIHVYWIDDAIQPSHPLSSPSPPALNLSQHQGLFQRVSSSHQVAKILELQLHHQFPMTIQNWFPLELISLLSKGFSRDFSSTTIQKHQFFSTQPSLWSSSHIHTWLLVYDPFNELLDSVC